MRTSFIVLFSPRLHKPLCFLQIHEDVFIQAFITEFPIEALDVSVLVGLARLDVIPSYSLFLAPPQDCHARKFCSVIAQNPVRFSSGFYDLLQFLANSAPIEGCVYRDLDALSGKIIYYCQHPDSPPALEHIMHKIQRPLLILFC